MPKWFKMIVGVLLLPLCAGTAKVLWGMLTQSGAADQIWVPMLAGCACWLVIFTLLPKPMWIYVVGHEVTHAVWTWLFGGKVKGFKATSKGGHVRVTKTNFLISLAPYFFPFYAALVVAVFCIGNLVWNWQREQVWFHLVLGAAWAFHLTLTYHILKTRQSDITEQGYLFSAVIIFLGNALVLLVGWPLLIGKGHLLTVFSEVLTQTAGIVQRLAHLF